jgi:O-6-methylguanine DNA methyltransferase
MSRNVRAHSAGRRAAERPAEDVHLTEFDTPLGRMALASTPRGVVACSLPGAGAAGRVRRELQRRVPGAAVSEGPGRNAPFVAAAREFLAGRRRDLSDVPLDLRGTDFQRAVWSALRRVPFGATISYGELAARAGRPGAARACGAANGCNPLPLFVPCHRTIGADGSLTGFGGGLELKRRLLGLEREALSS